MTWKTLLLDASFQPVEIVDWKRAIVLLLTGDAEIVEEYEDVSIRSVSQTYRLPSILRLIRSFTKRKKVEFSRYNVFFRDNWSCQYCGLKCKSEELTFDHVEPRCARTASSIKSWENIVAACIPCNRRKGGRTPDQVGPAQVYQCSQGHKTYFELRGTKLPQSVRCLSCQDESVRTSQVSPGMKLRKQPSKPTWMPQMTLRLKSNDPESWRSYLYWNAPLEEGV